MVSPAKGEESMLVLAHDREVFSEFLDFLAVVEAAGAGAFGGGASEASDAQAPGHLVAIESAARDAEDEAGLGGGDQRGVVFADDGVALLGQRCHASFAPVKAEWAPFGAHDAEGNFAAMQQRTRGGSGEAEDVSRLPCGDAPVDRGLLVGETAFMIQTGLGNENLAGIKDPRKIK